MATEYPGREDHHDLGDGVSFTWASLPRDDTVVVGLVQYHPTVGSDTGRYCGQLVVWDGAHGWPATAQLEAGGVDRPDELTLVDELVCPECGHRGRIVDGRWVGA
jgi:hypothetical protein